MMTRCDDDCAFSRDATLFERSSILAIYIAPLMISYQLPLVGLRQSGRLISAPDGRAGRKALYAKAIIDDAR